MKKSYEMQYHTLEEDYWWFIARRKIIFQIMENFPKDIRILDLGCSGGILVKELKKAGYTDCTGVDISPEAIALCKKRGISSCDLMDASKIKFSKKFDVIIASDILEHIKNDSEAIQNWKESLNDGGRIILFVPAFKFLWNRHDVDNQHHRRYDKKIKFLFKNKKMVIERFSYWNLSLFLPTLLFVISERLFSKNSKKEFKIPSFNRFINSVILAFLSIENFLLRYINLPFGLSIFLIAKKQNLK